MREAVDITRHLTSLWVEQVACIASVIAPSTLRLAYCGADVPSTNWSRQWEPGFPAGSGLRVNADPGRSACQVPRIAAQQPVDRHLADAKHPRQLNAAPITCFPEKSYGVSAPPPEPGVRAILGSVPRGAPLLLHVRHVFRVRSKEQMGRVDARRVVASMAHAHPVRDWPVVQLPRVSVCLFENALGDVPVVPVPVPGLRRLPRPALIRTAYIHLGPECAHANSAAGTRPTISLFRSLHRTSR